MEPEKLEELRALLADKRYEGKSDAEILALLREKRHDPLPVDNRVSDADLLGGVTQFDLDVISGKNVIPEKPSERPPIPEGSQSMLITRPGGKTFVWYDRANKKNPPDIIVDAELSDEALDELRAKFAQGDIAGIEAQYKGG